MCILGKLARLKKVWGRVEREFPDGSCGGKFRKTDKLTPKGHSSAFSKTNSPKVLP